MKQLYTNGIILTMNDKAPLAEAVLVDKGKIEAVGTLAELEASFGRTERIDLQGATMLPGFIDAHSHISMASLFPRFCPPPVGSVDSREKLLEEVRETIAQNPPKKGAWFIGMGYDNAFFEDSKHPAKEDLDTISTDIPIALMHASGHVGVLNSKGLEIAGITADTPAPDGGKIDKDEHGQLTGLLEESALTKILTAHTTKAFTPSFMMNALERAQDWYASHGITTAQDGAAMEAALLLFKGMGLAGKLKIDIVAYPVIDGLKNPKNIPAYDDVSYSRHFRVGGGKLLLDGSPQAKTAWLTKPYHVVPEGKDPDYCGYPIYEAKQVEELMQQAANNRWQMLVHCNGDAAADQYLDAYEKIYGRKGRDARCVMIHAQTVREDQLDRMVELGMLPSFFHDHTFFWGDYHMDSVLGPERGRRISPLTSALKRNLTFTIHQDTPVVPPNMILTLHNAVNRKTRDGRDIGPEFAVDVDTALKALTIWSAYQYHEENSKGSIEPGKLADFVILDKDPHAVSKTELKDICILETIKEGKTIYKRLT